METENINTTIINGYLQMLNNLSPNSKLDLISKLSQSLKNDRQASGASLQSLFGAYKSEETAEEIIAEIRASRVFNRNIETL